MDSVYETFRESLESVMKTIRNEIRTGKIDSHVTLKQEGDTFSLITKLKGKPIKKQTWSIPQEDRDTHITLKNQVEMLRAKKPFLRLIQAIRSTRHMMHSDEVWMKNIVDFMGESQTLDEFIHSKHKEASVVDTIKPELTLSKKIQNERKVETETNIVLQSLYQSLALKWFSEYKDVAQYKAFQTLLKTGNVLHRVRKPDNSIVYIPDGEAISGEIEASYASLKEFTSEEYVEHYHTEIGSVKDYKEYMEKLQSLDVVLKPEGSSVSKKATHFIVVNGGSQTTLGNGSYEGYVNGVKTDEGERIRRIMSYGKNRNNIPVVLDGKLYSSKIAAIVSHVVPHLTLGDIGEDTAEETLWEAYCDEYVKSKETLLEKELDVMMQNFFIHSQDVEVLRNLRDRGVIPQALTQFNSVIYRHSASVLLTVLEAETFRTDKADENAMVLFKWVIKNKNWKRAIQSFHIEEKTWDTLVEALETAYSISFTDNTKAEKGEFVNETMEEWIETETIEWTTSSLEQSLVEDGYVDVAFSVEDLIQTIKEHGVSMWNTLKANFERVPIKYIQAYVLGVYLSILHPKLKNVKTTTLQLKNARRMDTESLALTIGRRERDMVREYMETIGRGTFELEAEEDESEGTGVGAGATERKEEVEIDDLEIERKDEIKAVSIFVDRGMNMRVGKH